MRISLVIGAALIAGCTFNRITPGGSGIAGNPGRPPNGPGTLKPGVTDVAGRRSTSATTQTLCRSQATPKNSVIIDYADSGNCPASGDSTARNAMIVLDLRRFDAKSTVRMCRDQPVPEGWYPTANDEKTNQCVKQRGGKVDVTTVDITKRG